MTKEEFENRIDGQISAGEWEIVDRVYTWHPSIPNVGGKDVIAQLFKLGGMAVITDMDGTATARECMHDQLKEQINEITETVAGLSERIRELNAELARRVCEKSDLLRRKEELKDEFRNMGF